MNRTSRLYALVEELRASAPRPLTVAALAARFEVSTRTAQRDLQALMESGVPVRAVPGRGGGWTIDPAMTLPPIHFTAQEASALAAALAAADASAPYAGAARTAYQKIAASMTGPAAAAAGIWPHGSSCCRRGPTPRSAPQSNRPSPTIWRCGCPTSTRQGAKATG
ncbi:helix-turn-helix transcriptional regulator [Streptomyces sirii]|uniref:helix-turn-helix transcriptional regulator n=1 Tax=Streptomyces sirii TaxID=3127701 RepID=UPI003D3698F7